MGVTDLPGKRKKTGIIGSVSHPVRHLAVGCWAPIPRPVLDPMELLMKHGQPKPGTPVYCKLARLVEHTGIYVGNNEIVHLDGDGGIEIVSPQEFVARLDGWNPLLNLSVSIYYAADTEGKALGKTSIANRARSKVGGTRNYQWLLDNCHQFTCGCISGNFENSCNFFCMVESEIKDKLGTFSWAVWDYTSPFMPGLR